jgi:3-carboxy-cis,cis-muconate cycloisomerase
MAARTLLQHAVPTTFGLKAAGWLEAVVSARARLAVLRARLPVQLGGAAGTLAALGFRGPEVALLLAAELDLAEQRLPWHTDRTVTAELGAALAVTAGTCARIGYDIALLEQTEVAEVREPAGRGGSSTMPQKRNPVGSAIAVACERRVRAAAGVLLGALVQEHERAVGAWQAEWGALSDALAYGGGAAAAVRGVLEDLEVDTARMRANLDATRGAIVSERLTFLLSRTVGHEQAKEAVTGAVARASGSGGGLGDELAGLFAPAELEEALDPTTYIGAAGQLVDAALDHYRRNGDG